MSHEPGSFEKRLRFGCGFTFGSVVAFGLALQVITEFSPGFWTLVVVAAFVCGWLARRYGDAFWEKVGEAFHLLQWWRPH